MAKIVYADGDYTKVARGTYSFEDDFIKIVDSVGNEIRIGKRFVISIKEG